VTHANGAGNYTFSCDDCHGAASGTGRADHDTGTFQNVLSNQGAALTALTTGNGLLSPVYNPGTATCSAVYCHSNGGARAAAPVAAVIPAWTNGNGTISTCDACHGNTAATMGAKQNSAAHEQHLAKGYACSLCHSDTASNATTLAANAIGGNHVNNAADVVYDASSPLLSGGSGLAYGTDGTCSVYCHDPYAYDGANNPDWDTAATWDGSSSVACGSCHGNPPAQGAHAKHVSDADGPGLSCDTCHPAGSNTGSHAGHINGGLTDVLVNLQTAVCNTCHGVDGAETAPVWTNATTLDCASCHTNTLSTMAGTPDKTSAETTGHNKASGQYALTLNAAANLGCEDCHDRAATGHLTGGAGDMRLQAGFACLTCHDGSTAKLVATHTNIGATIKTEADFTKACLDCHDPHGGIGANAAMIDVPGVVFTARTNVNSFDELDAGAGANADDICATCHTTTGHNNQAVTGSHNENANCMSCHGHDKGFMASGGSSCEDCHSAKLAEPLHAAHIDISPTIDADKSECAICHPSVQGYTIAGGSADHFASVANDFAAGITNPQSAGTTCSSAMGCHASSVADGSWQDVDGLNCDACHYSSVTPTLLGNNSAAKPLTGDHSTHFDAIGVTCADCHTVPAAGDTAHISNTDGADQAAVLTGRANALQDEALLTAAALGTGTDPVFGSPGNATCNNAQCHAPSGGSFQATWNTANALGCAFCHSETDPATSNHTAHLAASVPGTFGLTVACLDCHVDNGVNNAHRDGVVDVTGTRVSAYTAPNCTNNCHTDGAGGAPAVAAAWGDAPLANCVICHKNPMDSARHTVHLDNNVFVAGDCAECHTAETAVTHIDLTVNTGGTSAVVYASGTGGCTNNCHTVTAATFGDWKDAAKLDCGNCHGAGGTLDKGNPPATGAHNQHVGNVYVSDCTDCHGDNSVTHSPINNVTAAIGGAKVSAYAANNCTNTCHVATNVNDWTSASRACVDCHTSGKIGTVPTSGLHATTVALAHDDNFGAGGTCNSCHTTTPTTSHIKGGAAQTSLQTTYNFNAANVVSYSSAAGCAANCHSDAVANGGVGKWSRKWMLVVDLKPLATDNPGAAVCDNCHGDGMTGAVVNDNWNAGLAPGHGDVDGNNGIEMMGQHGQCETCHGWGGATYNKAWNTGSPGHGDGSLAMNGPDAAHGPVAGAQYDEAAFGCLAACHSGSLTNAGDANFNHALADSTWPINYGDFGSGDCDTCHAAAVPSRDHSDATENLGMHTTHVASGYVTDCAACHPHDGTSVAPGTGVHGTGTVNFAGQMLGATDYSATAFGGTCATANGCHDSAANEWAAGTLGGNSCVDCHGAAGKLLDQGGYPPTSSEHAVHLANDAIFPPASDCDKCHGAGAVSGAHTGHKDMGASINLDATVITAYNGTNCANTCHTSVAGAWTSGAATLSCSDCHNAAGNILGAPVDAAISSTVGPTGDKHGAHLANSTFVADCATCHTHNGELGSYAATGHVNGTNPTLVGTLTVNGDSSCANACHLAADANEWISGALNCNDCHSAAAKSLNGGGESDLSATVGPNAGRHDEHMASSNYVTAGCTDCHGHSGSLAVASHVDGANSVASKVTSYDGAGGCANSCHDVNVAGSGDWADSNALACADCHAANAVKDLGNGAWPPVSSAHGNHLASNALPNAAQSDCYACHDGTIDNTGALKAAGTHLNLTSGDLAFNGSFNYEAGTAGRAAGAAATTTCSAVLCHNGITTPTWGAGTISCGQCHNTAGTGPLPSGSIGGSHSAHANNDGDFADCENCHTGANGYSAIGGVATHQNLTVNLNRSYTDNGAAGVNYAGDGLDNGSCATVDCHFNNTTPAWGAVGATTCTTCHNNGTDNGSLANAVPTATAGIHDRHVTDAATAYVDDCNACHGANASTGGQTGHANLATTYGNSLGGYAAGSCSANLCHDDAAGNLWVNGATLTCNDCHNATGKSLYVSGALTAATPPATGKHDLHDANSLAVLSVGCSACHPHSGSFAAATHADGGSTGLASNVDLSGSIAAPVETQTGWTSTCTNACHSATAGDEWSTGTLECSDCHSGAYVGGVYSGTGQHNAHNLTTPATYTTAAARTANAGAYDFNCANCHGSTPANHMNDALNVAAGVNYTLGNCSSNACHQNGQGAAAAVVANWTSGWVSDPTTDTCDNCHGNTPTTGAHAVHAVGIHAEDIYTGTTGLLAASASAPSAHGDGTTSTVISCNVCHNNTVTSWYNANNTACVSCHDTSNTSLGDNALAITTFDSHVNSIKDVVFQNIAVKSKAQLRDDITAVAEINNNWTRTSAYKGAGDFDQAKSNLSADSYADVTCTNACHNGIAATWQAPQNNCMTCHTQLPK
jgi:predicted CxxxxCH...CXXCH cytochrome family protein